MSAARKLCEAGPIARIVRVGHAPFGDDDPIEIFFQSGAVFHVDIGIEGASDIQIREGCLLETAYGHLRREEPLTFAAIERGWSQQAMNLPWLLGAALANPRRLRMTQPYRQDVGYAFDVAGRTLAVFGEADAIIAASLDDPEIADYGLEIGPPV